jgi:hypothetical protein
MWCGVMWCGVTQYDSHKPMLGGPDSKGECGTHVTLTSGSRGWPRRAPQAPRATRQGRRPPGRRVVWPQVRVKARGCASCACACRLGRRPRGLGARPPLRSVCGGCEREGWGLRPARQRRAIAPPWRVCLASASLCLLVCVRACVCLFWCGRDINPALGKGPVSGVAAAGEHLTGATFRCDPESPSPCCPFATR